MYMSAPNALVRAACHKQDLARAPPIIVAVVPRLPTGTLELMYVPAHLPWPPRYQQEQTGERAGDAVAPSEVVQRLALQLDGVLASPEVLTCCTSPSPG